MNEINTIPSRKMFTDTLLEHAQQDKDVIVVTTDARGSVTLTDFAKQLPSQFVELGIAEQNAVGVGAGLAQAGKKVFVCGPACFYAARSIEQVKVDVAYSGSPVKILGVSGGVSYGALGYSHHSLHDIAAIRTFPGMYIFLPCDIYQTKKLVEKMVDFPHPAYIRVGRNAVPCVYDSENTRFEIGSANTLLTGSDLTLIGTGETVYHCLKAGEKLHDMGIKARVIDMHTIKPIDKEIIEKAAIETNHIITVEEHSIFGGLGGAVAEIIGSLPQNVQLKILGIPDEFAVHGKAPEIFRHYGINADGIYDTAINFIKQTTK